MEYHMPIGRRTRLQRALREREQRERNKRAKLEARIKYRRELHLEEIISDGDDDEEEVKVVDEAEYLRRIAALGLTSNSPNKDSCVKENEHLPSENHQLDRACDDKSKGITFENVNVENSDDSLQLIGESWNPLVLGYDNFDCDEVEDVGPSSIPQLGNSDSDSSSSRDDELRDQDFKVDEDVAYVSPETSSLSSSEEDDDSEYTSADEDVRRVKTVHAHPNGAGDIRDKGNRQKRKKKRKEGIFYEHIQRRVYEGLVLPVIPESNGQEDDYERGEVGHDPQLKSSVKRSIGGRVHHPFVNFVRKTLTHGRPKKAEGQEGTSSGSRKAAKKSSAKESRDDTAPLSFNNGNKKSSGETAHLLSFDNEASHDRPQKVETQEITSPFERVRSLQAPKKSSSKKSKEKAVYVSTDNVIDKLMSTDRPEKEEASEGSNTVKRRPPKNPDVQAERISKTQARKLKTTGVQDTLLNNIMEGGREGLDDTVPPSIENIYLPLKFVFPPKEVNEAQRSDDELEPESLFEELDFALQACDIGSDGSCLLDGEDVASSSCLLPHMLCAEGKHSFIHDEEIGIVCEFCSLVKLESKYITPDFNPNIFGKGDSKVYHRSADDDKMDWDAIQLCSSANGDLGAVKAIQGTVWELIPGVWRSLYPHQREGFEFIWRNVAGGLKLDELSTPSKFGLGGCIICHAPGTGKTRLAIVFIQSFMKQYPLSKPVIIAPRSMLRTWQEEFARWQVDVPFFNINDDELSSKEDPEILNCLGNSKNKKSIRIAKLYTWARGTGVLAISYGLYEKLAGDRKDTDDRFRQTLLKQPGILVLDEGHTPRNDKSNIWRVLSEVSTKRRVILSGTPFQNNFDELSNTISLVREELGVPILSGNYGQPDDKKIKELRDKIRPFVHVHKGEILKQTLRGLSHSLLILKPSKLQNRCFAAISGQQNFALDNLVSITSVHPSILLFCEQRAAFLDKEWETLLRHHEDDLDAGVKTRFLVELIKLSQGERVLVFGQFLPPLNFLVKLLVSRFHWTVGREILYMDGKQDAKERQNIIRGFNDPGTQARVLLASTKACSEGIHLVGASRVVLLDVVWNPSVERQAISRAYRLGQKRDVYVYHLITSGSLEEQKYRRQASKERLAELVFVSSEKRMQKESIGSKILEDKVLDAMMHHEKLKSLIHKYVNQPKADNHLIESFGPLS